MQMSFATWVLAVGVAAAAAFAIRRLFSSRSDELDAGAVSQSWLTEHKAGKGERFS